MSERVRVRATVRGRVQMVGFRMFVLDHAGTLQGTVSNRPDGTVECLLEGEEDEVDAMIRLLHEGPRHARVEGVDLLRQPYRGDLPPLQVTA